MAKRTSTSTTATQSAAVSKKASPAKPVVEKAAVAAARPKAAPRAKAAAPQVTFMITPEAIAQRAYEIWRQKGGMEMENWLQAERELRGETAGR